MVLLFMKRFLAFFIFIFLIIARVSAQYNTPQNYLWYFGHNAALNFASGTPVAITTSAMWQDEGSVSVANAAGTLLFYSDGDQVWNRNNVVMAGSTAGCAAGYSTSSTTQGALVVPDLTNPNRYYLFSIEEMEDYITGDAGASRLYYSIIDMTLNGGLGDIVPGTRATLLANPVSEKLIAIPGNNNNIWIVTHERNSTTFKVYEMSSTGFNTTPVSYSLGYFAGAFSYAIGVMKVSPNRRMIVAQNWNDVAATGFSGPKLNGTEIYDFDPCTGVISNARTLDSLDQEYGAEFSPDNKKLYVNENVVSTGLTKICQYDVTGATAAAIRATKYTVVTDPNTTTTEMRLASNGKIYFGTLTSLPPFYLSSINTPNTAGAGCGYQNNSVTLSPATTRWWEEGLPNVFQNVVPADTTYTHTDTTFCFTAGTSITLTAPTGSSYYWWDGVTTSTHTISSVGNYWVRVRTTCGWLVDTFRVTSGSNPITGTTAICVGNTTTLSNATPGGTWTTTNTTIATVGSSSGIVTGVSTGTARITYSAAGGGCNSVITVTVSAVAPITGPSTVCQGGSVTLSNITTSGTWTSSNTNVATITSGTGVVYGVSPGTSVIMYTSPMGCFTTFTITVNSATPITGPASVCAGSTVTLSNATGGGTWSSGSPGVATIGSSSGVVTGVSNGAAVITYTTPAGCIATMTFTVNAVLPITGATNLCLGSSTQLSDATPGGTWTSSNTSVATIVTSTGMLNSVSLGTTIIRYSLPSGCFATYTVNIVSVTPISGNMNVCVGRTTTLSNSATGGTWASGAPAVATIGTSTGIVSGVGVGNAPITYTIGSCISYATVTVNPLPAAISGGTPVCAGNTVTVNSTTPGGTWSSSNPSVASVHVTTGVVTGATGGSVTITYTLPTGCYVTAPLIINPLPAGITGPASVCLGGTAMLANTSPGGIWSCTNTTVINVVPATGLVTGMAIGSANVTYTLPTGCLITTTVGVSTPPDPPVTADLSYCQRDDMLPALTAIGSGLQWYTSATGGVALAGAPTPSTTAPGTFTWYVSQSLGGCEGVRAPLNVVVHPKAERPLIAPEKPEVCQYDTLNYNYIGTTFPGIMYAWVVPANGVITSGAANAQNISVSFDSSQGRNYVTLTVGDGYTPCNVTDTVSMIVHASTPEADFYVKPDICLGDTVYVALTKTTPETRDYAWHFGAPGSYYLVSANSNHGGPFRVVYPESGVHIISMTAMSNAACPSRLVSDTVMVHRLPDARIAEPVLETGKTRVCIGDSVLLQPETPDYQNHYWWTPEHSFSLNGRMKVYGRVESAGPMTLTVTDAFGCSSVGQVVIDAQSCCVVSFPNAFTPNGDGHNDVFRPITPGNHKVHVLRIENRFGQVVFTTNNEQDSWDGTFNGVPQDLGVYFYYFQYDCEGKTHMLKGDVTLVR